MIKTTLIKIIVVLCKGFSKSEKKIVYHSYPDFSDNSFATYVYISNYRKEYKNVWLVGDYSSIDKYRKLSSNYTNNENLIIVKKKSFTGLFHYITAKTVFTTHGVFDFLGLISGQKKVNLHHGMPLKKYGITNGTKAPISDYHVATSSFYQKIISEGFNVPSERVLIVGQTRNDFLFENNYSINELFNNQNKYKKNILWMPTYRKSIIKHMKEIDGNVNPEFDFLANENLISINKILKRLESICYIKIHPMDYRKVSDFNNYSNIQVIDNSSFDQNAITMYSVFNSIDILLTDFSSVYIDFLLLNRPIGFVFSDFEEYKNSRGFVFPDPENYMPGEKITNIDILDKFLTETIIDNIDNHKEAREKIKKLFHNYDKNFSEVLIKEIF